MPSRETSSWVFAPKRFVARAVLAAKKSVAARIVYEHPIGPDGRLLANRHRAWTVLHKTGSPGTVLLEAEERFHRIQGYQEMPLLI